MTALIAAGVIGDTSVGHTKAELAVELEDLRDFIAESVLGASARYELTIASGAVTPPDGATAGGAIYKLDTEGGASTDVLDTIAQTNTHDGQLIILMAENTARVVTLNHGAGGTGEMTLTDGLDFALDTASKWIMFRRDGSAWVELMRYAGADAVGIAAGQCRLDWTLTSVLTLSRYNGAKLFIDGAWRTIPSTGPTLSNATALIETGSLANNTTYYVYAYMSGTTLTLGASATAPATDANYGHRIRTGDAAKTLVGMFRTNGSAQFTSADLTLSWFNQRMRKLTAATLSSNDTVTTVGSGEATALAVNFLTWASEQARAVAQGYCFNSGAFYTYAYIGVDSASFTDGVANFGSTGAAFHLQYESTHSEGYHTATLYGWVNSASTGTFIGNASSGGQRCSMFVEVMG